MSTRLFIASLCAAVVSTMAPLAAQAAPCAGFGDLDDSSAFCRNVEWIKNRGVTVGCDTGIYCPGQVVSRAAMAAFLHRLGSALSTRLTLQGTTTSFVNLDAANQTICPLPKITAPWAQRAHGRAIVSAFGNAGPADITARFIESFDDGATWNDASPAHAVTATDGSNTKVTLSLLLPPRDHDPGTGYSYAVRVGRVPGSATTGNLGDVRCAVTIAAENRNPETPPFDADE